MLTTEEAFAKFRTRMELTEREQTDASRRQLEIREHMSATFAIDEDFLTGSYKRHTKTKPLKDVDIFCVLGDEEGHYRDEPPAVLLGDVEEALIEKYGREAVSRQRRSVSVDFGVQVVDDDSAEHVLSFDVVPAFGDGDGYEIPDVGCAIGWTKTNPRVHAERATASHHAYAEEWKGLVRMMKYWNNHHDRPIRPSFLIEVMALDVLFPPYGGSRAREMQAFFATLADRVHEVWRDPARLGPPVSDLMDESRVTIARKELRSAQREAAAALALTREGKQGEALRTWRGVFGPLFPLS